MSGFDATNAQLTVFSFKEGLLSRVAHDLELQATSFKGQSDGGMLTVAVKASGLKVTHAMKKGRPDPGALSEANRAEIEGNLHKAVLGSAAHPRIIFKAAVDGPPGPRLQGTLTLKGVSHPVTLVVREEGDAYVGEATLHQPDFGIKPFSALMGALKIKPDVKVVARVPKALVTT